MTQERLSWDGETTTAIRERGGRHGHLYYNRGGIYRGYEVRTDDCHPANTVVKLWLQGFAERTGRTARASDETTGLTVRST